nr:hypothetical protein [Tanacetum cinerariifolium]
MGDEHLDTVLATESKLVPNLSESEGENECDVPACFTTFSNILFDDDYDFYSVDDQSLSDEDFSKEIYSNPLFDEEIISMKIDPHHFNVDETDCDPENEIRLTKRLLYDNSSSRPPEEFVYENSMLKLNLPLHLLSSLRILTLLWKKLIYPLLRMTQCRRALRR